MGRWLVTCIFWFFWVSVVCVRICKDVRWGCVLKGLFPLAYSILSLTFNRRLFRDLGEEVHTITYYYEEDEFFSMHINYDNPNQVNLSLKLRVFWDNSRSVASSLA